MSGVLIDPFISFPPPRPNDYVYFAETPVVGDTGIDWTGVDTTFSFWLAPHALPVGIEMIANIWGGASDALGLRFDTANDIIIYDDTNGQDDLDATSFTLTDAATHHVVWEVDITPRQTRLTVDGVVGSWIVYDGSVVGGSPIVLGERGNATLVYNGTMKRGYVYDRLLTDVEIQALYDEGPT